MNLLTEENVVRLRVGLYGGVFFFSFFTIIAVPVTTNKFDHCILYSDVKSSQLILGPDSNCNYVVAMAVIFGLIYGLFRLLTLLLLLMGRLSHDFVLFSDPCQLIMTAVDAVAFFLVFVSACILSAGINQTCSHTSGSCDHMLSLRDSSAASRIHVAEAGTWISTILWLAMVLLGVFWLFRQGKVPFLSRARPSGDGGSAATASAPSPPMDTPPASGDSKY